MSVALVVSTYDLGAQPLGVALVASALRGAGHEVLTCDLSVEPWPDAALARADCLCCSVPMHTALRLAAELTGRVRAERPGLPIYFFGLYAGVATAAGMLEENDAAIERDEAASLVGLLDALGGVGHRPRPLETLAVAPDRTGLPSLERYARFERGGSAQLVASVAASTGCNHRCRHCPVPVVYDGRSSAVELTALLADVEQLVAAGASHVHFVDPDFLNRPQHARRVVAALHGAFPELSFDATVKVSHVLRFEELLVEFGRAGLCFVVSAFESTSDTVLHHLDKGHRSADLHRCVELLRRAGIEPRPSFLPFTPWTTREDLVELLEFVASHDLVANVDPVQYGIRLLLPPRSLLLEQPDPLLAAALAPPEAGELYLKWASPDPLLDELALALQAGAEAAAASGESLEESYLATRATVFSALGRPDPGAAPLLVAPGPPPQWRGRLSEAWFCCAEPTSRQLGRFAAEPEAVFLGPTVGAAPPGARQ
jgi:hypothetical protein